MFTGIVEGLAAVKSIAKGLKKGADTVMWIKLGRMAKGLKKGDSVCINGACLTVTKLQKGEAQFEMVAETMRRTSLGQLKPGDKVNIERSMKVGDRLEGHFVLGHVDGTATIVEKVEKQAETTLWFELDSEALSKALVPKGSVAVDGISLTVVDVEGAKFSVSLIPHTLAITSLGLKKEGDKVNIETDVLSKYVSKMSVHS
ncbi:riboflavin synthase [Candidatus Nitrososphaera sp. FF02]|uniref:riboflavin synthase n=1 Tax=Candidatus Nitrososphaera sp. FF02 TaxID=3398226 RepID=UPI0039EA10F5